MYMYRATIKNYTLRHYKVDHVVLANFATFIAVCTVNSGLFQVQDRLLISWKHGVQTTVHIQAV